VNPNPNLRGADNKIIPYKQNTLKKLIQFNAPASRCLVDGLSSNRLVECLEFRGVLKLGSVGIGLPNPVGVMEQNARD
jgi:hypothetical protein